MRLRAADLRGGPAPREFGRVRIERHPQFDIKRLLNHLRTADLALIKLAEPLPARISPALIAGGSEAVAVGDSLVVAGYGVTVRGDGRTGGTVRAATLVVTGQPGPLQIRLFDPESKGVSDGSGACAGDSGAPAVSHLGNGTRDPRRGELVDRTEPDRRLRWSDRDYAAGAVSRVDR